MAEPLFCGDPATRALHEGTCCPVWGINANICSPPPAPLAEAYTRLLEDNAAAVAALLSTGKVYLYKTTPLHFTIASPAPFPTTRIAQDDPKEQEAITGVWKRAMEHAAKNDPDWPKAAFEVTAKSLVLSRNAGFMDFSDDSGYAEKLRSITRRIAAEGCHWSDEETLRDADTLARNRALMGKAAFKAPTIYHCTFLRFAFDVTDAAEAELIRTQFRRLQDSWKPVTVPVDNFILVNEVAPYMHAERLHDADVGHVAAKLTF